MGGSHAPMLHERTYLFPILVYLYHQVLMAAQEPLSHATLHQLGLSSALELLPGWPCLFYVADHHVYMLHKSLRCEQAAITTYIHNTMFPCMRACLIMLQVFRFHHDMISAYVVLHKSCSDWLRLLDNKPQTFFAPNVVSGHKALGAHLLKEVFRASPTVHASDYCLKYAILHLSLAGSECAELLDIALSRWAFLRAVFEAGHGGKLLSALGAVPKGNHSVYTADTYRWLAFFANDFAKKPEDMERTTTTNLRCPVGCLKFQEAAKRLSWQWIPRLQLGGPYGSDWPPDTSTFKVS